MMTDERAVDLYLFLYGTSVDTPRDKASARATLLQMLGRAQLIGECKAWTEIRVAMGKGKQDSQP